MRAACGVRAELFLSGENTFVFSQGAVHTRWLRGLPVAAAAAICDTLLISVAVSGISLVVLQISWFKTMLSWGGVIFLAYMGWATWRSGPGGNGRPVAAASWPLGRQLAFTASVSLLNPHAILDTIGVIGTNSLRYESSREKLAFTLACISVSWLWFFGLLTAGYLLGAANPNGPWRGMLGKVSAIVMWIVGAQFVWSLLHL